MPSGKREREEGEGEREEGRKEREGRRGRDTHTHAHTQTDRKGGSRGSRRRASVHSPHSTPLHFTRLWKQQGVDHARQLLHSSVGSQTSTRALPFSKLTLTSSRFVVVARAPAAFALPTWALLPSCSTTPASSPVVLCHPSLSLSTSLSLSLDLSRPLSRPLSTSLDLSRPLCLSHARARVCVCVFVVQEVKQVYQVSSMPTFKFIQNSQVVETFSGADAERLEATVKRLLADAGGAGETDSVVRGQVRRKKRR